MDEEERIRRLRQSIHAFERLHAVIVGFALTTSVRTFAEPWLGTKGDFPAWHPAHSLFVAFLVTLIPFFHGANRHIELAHLSADSSTTRGSLMFDYVMLFLEGAIFVLLGMAIVSQDHFIEILKVLLGLDTVWAATAWSFSKGGSHLRTFLLLNVACFASLLLVQSAVPRVAWPPVLAGVLLVRSIIDYATGWSFFFDLPPKKQPTGLSAGGV